LSKKQLPDFALANCQFGALKQSVHREESCWNKRKVGVLSSSYSAQQNYFFNVNKCIKTLQIVQKAARPVLFSALKKNSCVFYEIVFPRRVLKNAWQEVGLACQGGAKGARMRVGKLHKNPCQER